jgi:hypothetical protein
MMYYTVDRVKAKFFSRKKKMRLDEEDEDNLTVENAI